MPNRRTAVTLGAAALGGAVGPPSDRLLAQAQPAPSAAPPQAPGTPAPQAPPLPYRPHTVRTPDGVAIQAYEYGDPDGPRRSCSSTATRSPRCPGTGRPAAPSCSANSAWWPTTCAATA
jgi:hypothetical protein